MGLDNPLHIAFLLLLLLLVFGAKRLPEMGRSLGEGLRGFKSALSGEAAATPIAVPPIAVPPIAAPPVAAPVLAESPIAVPPVAAPPIAPSITNPPIAALVGTPATHTHTGELHAS
jgi:sec-independent protein translocase protein TatA